MFRELARKNKQISMEECVEVLKQETRGVLSVLGDEGYPYGTPMNHWYDEESGCIWFHCGRAGHRLDALRRCDKVSFCVYDRGEREEGGWALIVRSVVVFGGMEIVDDLATVADVAAKLSRKFTQDEDYIRSEIQKYAKGTLLLKLTPEHICGKRITES